MSGTAGYQNAGNTPLTPGPQCPVSSSGNVQFMIKQALSFDMAGAHVVRESTVEVNQYSGNLISNLYILDVGGFG